jgi:hypothetical protein
MVILILANLFVFSLTSDDTEADSSHRYPIDSFGGGVSSGLPSSGYYDCIAVGNINGDSYVDMVSGGDDSDGGSSTTGLYFYAGNGAGSWTETTIISTSRWAGVEIADCDNDGNLEVYAANQAGSGSGVGVWEYSGSSFGTSGITSPLTSGGVNYVNILNITGNSGLDLVAATHSGMKYYQGSGSSPISWTEYSSGLASSGQYTQSAVGDLNNDGRMDIIGGDYGNGLHIFTQDSGGTSWTDYSSTLPSTEQSGRILGLAVGDVNKDGNADIIFDRRTNPQGLFLLLGNGGGGTGSDFNWTYLNNSWVSQPGGTFYQMHLKDIDKDGDLDLLAPKEQYGLHLYLGNGSNFPGINFGWSEVTGKGLPTTMKFFGSNFIDFDNDGDLDVAGCTWGDGIHVYQNNLTLPDIPIARAGSNQVVFLGSTVNLDGTGSSDPQDCPGGDSTGNILTYDWNITAQPPGSSLTDLNLTSSDSVAKPSFIPTHVGDYWLSLRVRDTESHWGIVEDQVRITVLLTNQRPNADAGADQQVEINSPVTLDGSGSSDVEDLISQLVFDWNVSGSNPAVVTLNDESAIQPTFTAPITVGIYEFTLVVQDTLGNWSIEDSTNVSVVLPTNIKPVADAGEGFTAYSNSTILLNGSGSSDSDGSIITWDWNCTSHPGLTITNENSSTPEFTPTSAGIYEFTLTIKDDRGGWAVEDTVTITVIDPNKRPMVNAGEDFTSYVDELTYLNGSASNDIDGIIVTWDWNCTSHASLYMNNENSSNPSFYPFENGTYIFTLQVKDNFGLWSGLDSVNVTVIEGLTNIIPISSAGADFSVYVNTTVNLDGSNSSDEDGFIVTWLWNCISHPILSFTYPNSSQPTFYASEIGQYTITLQVKDNIGLMSTLDTIIITVLPEPKKPIPPENHPPAVTLDNGFTKEKLSETVSITWLASDSDGDTLSFTIELLDTNGDVVKTLVDGLETNARSWEWDTESEDDGDYQIRIIVNDGTDTVDDTSSEFTVKNKVSDVKDDETSSNMFTTGLGLGLLFLIIIIIVIIIVIVLVLKSKKKDYPPTSDERVDHQDYYGHPPPTSEPVEYHEQELNEPQEQWHEQGQVQKPEQEHEIEPSDEQLSEPDGDYMEEFEEEFEEDPIEETVEDMDLENDTDLEQDSEIEEEPDGLTTDELEEPAETDDFVEDNVEVEDSSSDENSNCTSVDQSAK